MPPDRETHGNADAPTKQESLQYITYSAKELLYLLNEKVDKLDNKMDEVVIEQAKLDSRYVTQDQFKETQRELVLARRFAIGSVIASIGAMGTFIGLIIRFAGLG